jgi:hypothetical protein
MIKSKRTRWTGHAGRVGMKRRTYKVLVEIPEGKISLGMPRCISEDNIKNFLRKVILDVMKWIHLAQNIGLVECYENGNEPSGSIKYWEFLE